MLLASPVTTPPPTVCRAQAATRSISARRTNVNATPSLDAAARRLPALKLTAIVCAYNEEKTLPAALHSLFAQTRVPDEVIVVNNASTDGTRAVAERIPGVVVVDEPEKGLVRARAKGMQVAQGDILLYIDA